MNNQKILDRLDIPQFYRELVPSLMENGKPEALGLCPFHDDHDPSLSVNIITGLYRCFSCGAKGDVFTFYQKTKGVDFRTALKDVGEMAGVVVASAKPKVVATFEYKNENDEVLYIKERQVVMD